MVGIFKFENGLKFIAISTSVESAKREIFNRYCQHPEYYYDDVNFWWERVSANNSFVIEEVDIWGQSRIGLITFYCGEIFPRRSSVHDQT